MASCYQHSDRPLSPSAADRRRQFPFRPIEKKSLDRFIPMYNVAVNLCTKVNDNRFTFILMLNCRHLKQENHVDTATPNSAKNDYLSLYAVRTFIDADAKRVKDMLDYAYFEVMARGLTGNITDNNNDTRRHKTYIEYYLFNEWQKTMHPDQTSNQREGGKRELILPSVYCYLFDSANYTVDELLSSYQNTATLADVMAERREFQARVSNYMNTPDCHCYKDGDKPTQFTVSNQTEAPYSEAVWIKRLIENDPIDITTGDSTNETAHRHGKITDSPLTSGFESNFYTNPNDNSGRLQYESRMPEQQNETHLIDSVNYDEFLHRFKRQGQSDTFNANLAPSHHAAHTEDALRKWLDILNLCDCHIFTEIRRQRDFPDLAANSYALAMESVVCTLSMQYFCTRNKINDIIRHVFITGHPERYVNENHYLRNFSSYCEWRDSVDVNHTITLAKSLCFSPILLEWLDNDVSLRAFTEYTRKELAAEITLIPSHDLSSPPTTYQEVANFNFRYFFISCHRLKEHCQLPSCDLSVAKNAWHVAMNESLGVKSEMPVVMSKKQVTRKRSLVSLSDIIPLPLTSHETKRPKSNLSNNRDTDPEKASEPKAHNTQADMNTLSIRERLFLQAWRRQGKNSDNVMNKFRPPPEKWYIVVDKTIYGKTTPILVEETTNSDKKIAANVVADLDVKTLAEQSNIRIISYFGNNPVNGAPIKKWLSRYDIDKKKKKIIEQKIMMHYLTLAIHADIDPSQQGNQNDSQDSEEKVTVTNSHFTGKPPPGLANREPTISAIISNFKALNYIRSASNAVDMSIEQLLFLEIFLTFSSSKRAILINGNPGTGKTTVMMHLIRHFNHLVICLLPTKVLRERMINMIKSMMEKEASAKNNLSGLIPGVMTFSALIKRLMRYKMSPQVYSRVIERYLTGEQQRMYHTVRPAFLSENFLPTQVPVKSINYPHIAFIDEYNLIDWHQHLLIGEALEMLRVTRVLYGDSGQSAPICSTNDNTEMISLRCALTIQFLENKRIINSSSALSELLSDPIWNWRSNNDNTNVCNYVRSLLDRYLSNLVSNRIVIHGLSGWFSALSALLDWYDKCPCRRQLCTISDMCELLNRIPPLPLPCIIALKNKTCDRSNYWLGRAVRDYVIKRCHELETEDNHGKEPRLFSRHIVDNYCMVIRRNAYAKQYAYHANEKEIETKGTGTGYIYGTIADDPWCADLTLIIGAVYRFIGCSTLIERDSLLQLIAFLPEKENTAISSYCCDHTACRICHGDLATAKRAGNAMDRHTMGCGPPREISEFELGLLADCKDTNSDSDDDIYHDISKQYVLGSMPRLLMRRVYSESVHKRQRYIDLSTETKKPSNHLSPPLADNAGGEKTPDKGVQLIRSSDDFNNVFIIKRAYYTLTRCSSVWTPNLHTMENSREGMQLYGYPLALNASITSYRVQGETISDTDVYIDFERMGKEQALVALSRVRRFEQICGVINIDKFGR